MATEKSIYEYLEEAGFAPVENRTIIVECESREALSKKNRDFFSDDYYILQLCKDELVLIPFQAMSTSLKKEIALRLPYASIRAVDVKETGMMGMSYEIIITTDTDRIRLLAQKEKWSEFRHSGTLAMGVSFLSVGVMGAMLTKRYNWHSSNMDGTLKALQTL